MYTDGGYEYVEPEGKAAYELCGWGVTIRLRMRRYPNKEERERHGWRTEDIQTDIAGGYQVELETGCWIQTT